MSTGSRKSPVIRLLLAMAISLVSVIHLQAQQFQTLPPLKFTMPFAGGNPLPQRLDVASTAANFNYSIAATTSTGGSWLSVSPAGCCRTTPGVETVSVNAPGLAAGSYSGQVTFTSQDGTRVLAVPVTLTVAAAGTTFFDSMPGELSFSMKTSGNAPPAQTFPIRNAGSGTLNWTLTTSTASGGSWLTVSATSGTAPSSISVGISPSQLPGGGLVAGTFDGQLLFHTSGDDVTVPISVTVGANVFVQLNPISFNMPFGGGNPLPQRLDVASTGTNFNYSISAITSQGGNWLSVSPVGCCRTTPGAETVSVNAPGLAAGTYSGQVSFISQDGTKGVTVLVTLTVATASATFFDSVPGELSFSMKTGGSAPPVQTFPIRNAGSGTLNWTLTTSTADGGSWLTASAATGTAPSPVSIGITPSQLPNGGLLAGTFDGQVVLHTPGNDVTVPISVTVDANAFAQLNPISFSMPFGGGNPLPQRLDVASTGTNFNYSIGAITSQGGNWLSVSPVGCCRTTPGAETVTVNAPGLAAGIYSGQVTFTSQDGTEASTVLVTLTVAPSTATFFDSTPGELSFSMKTGGLAPPAQGFTVRNAGKGSLKYTLTTSTADGGAWLVATPLTGTAPKAVSVTVVPANLPGGGLLAGTFDGQLLFHTPTNDITVPVSMTVDANAFAQLNPINFEKPFGGANPLPQIVHVASTGTNFNYSISAITSQGGNWLAVAPVGCCRATPGAETISVNATGLAVGNYSGQVNFTSQDGTEGSTVLVTLTVQPASKAFFDNTPGQSSFSLTTTATVNPAPQVVPILNGGTGTLNWTAKKITADGGKWLVVTPTKGTSPSVATVKVVKSKLPGLGKIPGTYVGQQIFKTASGLVTVPVSVTVGDSVFVQLDALTFTTTVGVNPLAQTVTVASTGTNFNYSAAAVASKGGNWLTVSPVGCCAATPRVETVSVNSSTLPVGTYIGQVMFQSQNGAEAMTVPVILTVNP